MSVDHYENFPVASTLCPAHLRPAVRAIYAFARTADDLADEGTAPPAVRLAELAAFRSDLHAALNGVAGSGRWATVFDRLPPLVAKHGLPDVLFTDLLSAFEQDVVKQRYVDRAELLDYCRRSANPVGRLMLHLYGRHDALSLQQSDAICTALQLANFWQDLSVDTERGRLYVPLADCASHGVAAADLLARRDAPAVRRLLADMVSWTRALMLDGAPLAGRVAGRAGWELRFVVQGGLRILEKIERSGFDVLRRRPAVHKADLLLLMWRALTMPARSASPMAAA
jgi:squalene synthase HpnC